MENSPLASESSSLGHVDGQVFGIGEFLERGTWPAVWGVPGTTPAQSGVPEESGVTARAVSSHSARARGSARSSQGQRRTGLREGGLTWDQGGSGSQEDCVCPPWPDQASACQMFPAQ